MLQAPAQEKQLVSWLYVVIWSLIIFVTIPLARTLQSLVAQQWGREVFAYTVITAILAALLLAAVFVYRNQPAARGSYFWLVLVAAIFFFYTVKLAKKSPEEAIHFIQYGVLGILVYRALSHRLHDVSVYIAAAVICGIIGTVDEVIQWLTPKRFWGLRDVWLNFFAASLVQLSIARGLKPKFIAGWPTRANLRFICRLAIAAISLIGVCMLNTPVRIAWYAERVPGLLFLKDNESVMAEYGYLYDDPEIGIFRSRLSPAEIKRIDRQRGRQAADILNRYQSRSEYREFLEIYTPVSDPFLHEARVHLFSRDRSFWVAITSDSKSEKYARRLTEAFRENQIMEKYFTNTLRHSAYVWPADKLSLTRKNLIRSRKYDSFVSRNLITQVSEAQLGFFLAILLLAFTLLHWYLGRHESKV